jgi:hypothetical protein
VSRNGRDHTRRFADLAAAIAKLSPRSLVLDGEVAIYDQELRSRFDWLREPDPDAVATPPLFMAFDLLYLERRDLTARPLRDRRARLEDVVAGSEPVFPVRRLSPDGLQAWKQVIERGYEGYVAKDECSAYEGGPTRRWLKVKQADWTVAEDGWRRRLFEKGQAMMQLAQRALLVGGLLLLVIAASSAAWDEPDNFRGVPWGTSSTEARALLESSGEKTDCFGQRACVTARAKVGLAPVTITYMFDDDKFTMAMLTFAPAQYEALRAIFSDRYGPSSAIRDEQIKTRMGVAYTNQVATWAGQRVFIELRRYGNKVDQGRAVISLKEALDKRREETEKAIKKGKDDL